MLDYCCLFDCLIAFVVLGWVCFVRLGLFVYCVFIAFCCFCFVRVGLFCLLWCLFGLVGFVLFGFLIC